MTVSPYPLFFREHAAELNNAVPTKPLLFMKPPSTYISEGCAIEVFLAVFNKINLEKYYF